MVGRAGRRAGWRRIRPAGQAVVPFPPGGVSDLTARALAQKMSESMGQPIVVENARRQRRGRDRRSSRRRAPDGYTILLVDRGALGVNPEPLCEAALRSAEGLQLRRHRHRRSLRARRESVARRKVAGGARCAREGEARHDQLRELRHRQHGAAQSRGVEPASMGTDFVHVPYKGAGPAAQAVVAGEVGVAIASVPAVQGFINDGRVRALAVGSDKRFALLPDVPTLAEAGGGSDTLIPTLLRARRARGNATGRSSRRSMRRCGGRSRHPAPRTSLRGAASCRLAARRKRCRRR